MNFAMDFEWAGPTSLPYVPTAQPPPRGEHSASVNVAHNDDCVSCLRTALGCTEGNVECAAALRSIQSQVFKGRMLQAQVFTPVPLRDFGSQCDSVCSPKLADDGLFGSGYTRPYIVAAPSHRGRPST